MEGEWKVFDEVMLNFAESVCRAKKVSIKDVKRKRGYHFFASDLNDVFHIAKRNVYHIAIPCQELLLYWATTEKFPEANYSIHL